MTGQQRMGLFGVPGAVIVIVAMLVVPLPTYVLDLLITINMSAALVVLLTTMHVKKARDFSAFPLLLLIATMFRLAINVSVTRLAPPPRRRRNSGAQLRQLRGRRSDRRRDRRLPDLDHHPVRGGDEWRRKSLGGRRPFPPRRDGTEVGRHRRRAQHRADRREGGAGGGARRSTRRPSSTGTWTVPASSSEATPLRRWSSPSSTSSAVSPSG